MTEKSEEPVPQEGYYQGIDYDLLSLDTSGWEPWGGWSRCSLPCGGGMKYRHRMCSRDYCDTDNLGKRDIDIQQCNSDPCQPDLKQSPYHISEMYGYPPQSDAGNVIETDSFIFSKETNLIMFVLILIFLIVMAAFIAIIKRE